MSICENVTTWRTFTINAITITNTFNMNHKWPLSWILEVYYSFHPKAQVSLRNRHAGEFRKKKVLITNAMLNAHHFANSQDYFFFAVGWTVCCHWLWVFLYFLLCWQEQIPELACILVFWGVSLQTKWIKGLNVSM